MSKNNLLILIFSALIFLSGYIHAGERDHGFNEEEMEKFAEKRIEKMVAELELTEQQEASVRAIFDNAKQQHLAIREEYSGVRGEIFNRMEAVKEETKLQLSEVLTPEQLKKLEESAPKRPFRKSIFNDENK